MTGVNISSRSSRSSQNHSILRIKRVYEQADESDGYRVLVDRLWPRGISKQRAALDEWMKQIAPSPDLRKWWNHDPERMDEFSQRYCAELDNNPAVEDLSDMVKHHPTVTLIYAAKDTNINHAAVLRDYILDHLASESY
jgi:uncharacterized protein YeaO (DUF488 family)